MKNASKIQTYQYRKLSDDQLVYSFVHHNEPQAAITLYERYGHLLYGLACNYFNEGVKEVTEKFFLTVVDQLKTYREECRFKNWIFEKAEQYFRENGSGRRVKDFGEEVPEQALNVNTEEVVKQLESALDTLDDDQRACVDLFYIQKKTIGEIRAITHISHSQIKSHLQFARMQAINKLWGL